MKFLFILLFYFSALFANSVVNVFSVVSFKNLDIDANVVNGAKLYFDYFNKNSDILVNYEYFDDEFRSFKFKDIVVQNLDKSKILFMPVSTVNIRNIAPLVLNENLIVFTPLSGANFINYKVFENIIKSLPTYDSEMEKIVEFFTLNFKISKFGLFYQNGEDGEELYNSLQKALNSRGFSINSSASYRRNSVFNDNMVKNILKNSPEVIVLNANKNVSIKLIEKIRQIDKNVLIVFTNRVDTNSVAKHFSGDENIYFSTFTPDYNSGDELANLYLNLSYKAGFKVNENSYSAFLNAFLLCENFKLSTKISPKTANKIIKKYGFFKNQRILNLKEYEKKFCETIQ